MLTPAKLQQQYGTGLPGGVQSDWHQPPRLAHVEAAMHWLFPGHGDGEGDGLGGGVVLGVGVGVGDGVGVGVGEGVGDTS